MTMKDKIWMLPKIDTTPTAEDLEVIRQGIIAHNKPFLGGIRKDEVACYVRNEDDAIVAGATGMIYGHWLLIKFLWVSPVLQGQGYGTRILASIEQHAINEGCRQVMLDTYDFQARPFYEKLGYQCVLTLDNYPEEYQLSYMQKKLSAGAE